MPLAVADAGKHEHDAGRRGVADGLDQVFAPRTAKLQIEQDEVGTVLEGDGERALSCRGFANDRETCLVGQQQSQAFADDRVIFDNDDANGRFGHSRSDVWLCFGDPTSTNGVSGRVPENFRTFVLA